MRVRFVPWTVIFPGCVLAGTGCGDAGEAAPASRRDSAGVEIVTNAASRWSPASAWRVDTPPAVAIGSLDGPEAQQLYRAVDAVRLSDGRIAVANAGSSEIRFYGADGRHLLSAGGPGEGPGEFRAIASLDLAPGDTLHAFDARTRRISVFGPDGTFVRSLALEQPAEDRLPMLQARFAGGDYLARVGRIMHEPPRDGEILRTWTAYWRHRPDGTAGDSVAALPGQPTRAGVFQGGMQITFHSIPFAAGGSWAVSGEELWVGEGIGGEVRLLDRSGRVLRIVRWPALTPAVDRALFQAEVDRQLAAIEDEEWRRLTRQAYAQMTPPERVAAYDQMIADAGGNLWVRRPALPGEDERVWTVLDPSGELLGDVRLPRELRIYQIGEDFLLAREQDELGVERATLYRLVKP